MIEHQTSKFDRSIMTSPISITTLAALASAGVLRTVQLVGQVGGYTVMVRVCGCAHNARFHAVARLAGESAFA
ncbi:hypothetical protein EIJ50_20930 [Xanthomonas perforans]|nr:hypothetical protein EIJ50_20930 [Xanthomonas perforans]